VVRAAATAIAVVSCDLQAEYIYVRRRQEWAGDRNLWEIHSVAIELLPSCLIIGDRFKAIRLALACRGA
jgi:hypothetical protein